jgi:hypothetical protein
LEFRLLLEPGVVVGAVEVFPDQTLGVVEMKGRATTPGDPDPLVVSEMIRDLAMTTQGR